MTKVYLSRVQYVHKANQLRKAYYDVCLVHKLVRALFPSLHSESQNSSKQAGRILYYFDRHSKQGLIQSPIAPTAYQISDDVIRVLETKTVSTEFIQPNTYVRFRLLANPVDRSDDITRPLYTNEELVQWLELKGKQFGFQVMLETLSIHPLSPLTGFRIIPNRPILKKLYFHSIIFQGVLQITNADKFARAYLSGVGRGKAWGFGMLCVQGV